MSQSALTNSSGSNSKGSLSHAIFELFSNDRSGLGGATQIALILALLTLAICSLTGLQDLRLRGLLSIAAGLVGAIGSSLFVYYSKKHQG
jgi:hypothetical protein